MKEDNKKSCFIAKLENEVFLIPTEMRDLFDSTSYYQRDRVFEKYVIEDECIVEDVSVNRLDLEALIEGEF